MSEILLTTLNARYAHSSFGLRYLLANLRELQPRAAMLEFDVNQRTVDVLEMILAQQPRIVGIGVYIWNATQSLQLVADLKRLRPEIIVVLGGPEVSYETERQEICALADYVVTGEGDLVFAELCGNLLAGRRPLMKVIHAEPPAFEYKAAASGGGESAGGGNATDHNSAGGVEQRSSSTRPEAGANGKRGNAVALPYDFYSDADIANRVIYVEASRGCPFKCEFCLSSLDVPVRNVPLGLFLEAMQKLLDRGVRNFKFVDRTFNLNLNFSKSILQFFLDRLLPGLFLHFEMIPDRLPEALRSVIQQFPPGVLQFEVGVQTFNDEVSERISRRQDNVKLAENLTFLRQQTGVHVHADLIVGLPGENIESFAAGFDRLVALGPQEIQVGLLKRLRGTPIVRHDEAFGMVYSPHPPYEILQTRDIDFAAMQRLRRFARYWDSIANSGNFVQTTPLIWGERSAFWNFLRLADWLFGKVGQTHAIALQNLAKMVFEFLVSEGGDPASVAAAIWRDYLRAGRSDCPGFLRTYVDPATVPSRREALRSAGKRQARHLA